MILKNLNNSYELILLFKIDIICISSPVLCNKYLMTLVIVFTFLLDDDQLGWT